MLLRLRALPGMVRLGPALPARVPGEALARQHAGDLCPGEGEPGGVQPPCRRAAAGLRPQPARADQAVPRSPVDGQRGPGEPPVSGARLPLARAGRRRLHRARSRRWRRSAAASPVASSIRPTRAATPMALPARLQPSAKAEGWCSASPSRAWVRPRPEDQERGDLERHHCRRRFRARRRCPECAAGQAAGSPPAGLSGQGLFADGSPSRLEPGATAADRRRRAQGGVHAAGRPDPRRRHGRVRRLEHGPERRPAAGCSSRPCTTCSRSCRRTTHCGHWAGLRPLTPDGRPIARAVRHFQPVPQHRPRPARLDAGLRLRAGPGRADQRRPAEPRPEPLPLAAAEGSTPAHARAARGRRSRPARRWRTPRVAWTNGGCRPSPTRTVVSSIRHKAPATVPR